MGAGERVEPSPKSSLKRPRASNSPQGGEAALSPSEASFRPPIHQEAGLAAPRNPNAQHPSNARQQPPPTALYPPKAHPPHPGGSQTTDYPDVVPFKAPETKPITQAQLVAEVKGIYAGLVMVESKCIEIDNEQSQVPDGSPKLTHEQWQALIALHRTLLHEHHDFFLASQHPSASDALRRLASKYAMPARMWRHGSEYMRLPRGVLFV